MDSNDNTSGGRGSVDFSVKVGGAEKFRSGVMREGMPGKPVAVELDGATEFVLQIEETPDGISCDQADWVEAKITLKDGSELWLADLPLREGERAPYSTEPPFSFVYDGKASAELLKEWPCERTSRKLDEQRTERTSVWTDPAHRPAGALRRHRVWRFPDRRVGGALQEHRHERHADPVRHPGGGPCPGAQRLGRVRPEPSRRAMIAARTATRRSS